jgi:hypothetical protein
MKNKSIISAITFLLISMFYVNSASAGPTYINIIIPKDCGKYSVMGHQHCPRKRTETSTTRADVLVFPCVGGGNGRSVTSVKTASCGRVTVTTFSPKYYKHFAEITTNNGLCVECLLSNGKTNTYNIRVCPKGMKPFADRELQLPKKYWLQQGCSPDGRNAGLSYRTCPKGSTAWYINDDRLHNTGVAQQGCSKNGKPSNKQKKAAKEAARKGDAYRNGYGA